MDQQDSKNGQKLEDTCQGAMGTCQTLFSFTIQAVAVTFLKVIDQFVPKSTNKVLPYFSSPRGVATLDCESHSQAGSTMSLSNLSLPNSSPGRWSLGVLHSLHSRRCSTPRKYKREYFLRFLSLWRENQTHCIDSPQMQ